MKAELRRPPVSRKEDWPRALEDEIRRADARPFWWGLDDCCLFACNVIWRMTGTDLAAAFRGGYRTAMGSARAMRRILGAKDVEAVAEIVTASLAMPEITVTAARRGDLVLLDVDGGPALGVVDTSGRRIAAKGPDGIWLYSLAVARRAWRVG